MSDFRSPELEAPELPDIDAQLVGGGFEKDFAEVMKKSHRQQPTREVPPLHPKTISISDEEVEDSVNRKYSRNLFESTNTKKMRCEVGIFDLGNEEQKAEYQNMINNCLQKGWLLARDDWQRTPEGGAFAAVKVLIPETRRSKKGNDDA